MQASSDTDFLIAQLSDLHVRPRGELYQEVVDSNALLIEAIKHLSSLDRQPDIVLITGDLVELGHPEEYAMLGELLSELSTPSFVIPGNHDEREAFRAAFKHLPYLPRTGPLNYCIDDYPLRLIGLDTNVPGKHHGLLDAASLEWLDAALTFDSTKPTIVMLHHPPFLSGIPYMDGYRLLESERLAAVLERHTHVERVVCGHLHRTMIKRWAGTVVCSCPSTATEISLQLNGAAKPQSIFGPRGCLLHHWQPDAGLLTHVSNIGPVDGPYPFA
ncbi:MAG: phosphodiesterase [Burkholderiaceae bacterium]